MSFYEELLQSAEWQMFQEKNGKPCFRERDVLVIVESLPVVGKYFYAPRWPTFGEWRMENGEWRIKDEILRIAKSQKVRWVRVEPESEVALEILKKEFGEERVVAAPHDVQPREILVMDIALPPEELLAAMKSKTRYNIRLAEKHGVTVRFSRNEEDRERFLDLIYATTERKAIRPHPQQYYRNFFQVFSETKCVLALAEHEGKVLAANLLVFHGNTAYYLHGGSSDEGRHLMAPYLLQWRSIEEGKRRGATLYNFGGVDTQPITNNLSSITSNWSGITRFKQGFAPHTKALHFPGAYDIIVSLWWYRLYRILQKMQTLRKLFR